MDIADANIASVHGDQLRIAAVGQIASFFVHSVGADTWDIIATVSGNLIFFRIKKDCVLSIFFNI